MLKLTNRKDGRKVVTGTMADLKAANDWTQALCHAVYGIEKGEVKYRAMPMLTVMDVWAKKG